MIKDLDVHDVLNTLDPKRSYPLIVEERDGLQDSLRLLICDATYGI
ncbi:hypothetical protein OG205_05595 [Lentzea sp. NBC_00516]|nr:hypothetical protein [Lentzea sp. NBC_00516]WUD26479.1 hypothetical protein OG205_05595 [Lentzea sp. NBC_00516]